MFGSLTPGSTYDETVVQPIPERGKLNRAEQVISKRYTCNVINTEDFGKLNSRNYKKNIAERQYLYFKDSIIVRIVLHPGIDQMRAI